MYDGFINLCHNTRIRSNQIHDLSPFFILLLSHSHSPTSSHQPILQKPVLRQSHARLHDRRIGTVQSRVFLSHKQMKDQREESKATQSHEEKTRTRTKTSKRGHVHRAHWKICDAVRTAKSLLVICNEQMCSMPFLSEGYIWFRLQPLCRLCRKGKFQRVLHCHTVLHCHILHETSHSTRDWVTGETLVTKPAFSPPQAGPRMEPQRDNTTRQGRNHWPKRLFCMFPSSILIA
jgi:hypothetical protein